MGNWGETHDAEYAIFFHIGHFEVRTYPFCLMLGMIASILTIMYFWRRQKYTTDFLLLLVIVVIPVSIIGARIWYVMGRSSSDTSPWYAFWEGGLAIQGAVLFSASSGIVVCLFNRHTVDVRKAIGIIVPNILIGQVIGRWGNFANHEVFGRETTYGAVSWLGSWISQNMYFQQGNIGTTGSGYYVPLFFYESLINIIGWILLVWVFSTKSRRKWFKPGAHGAMYLIWYGIVRAILEPLRNQSDILKWGVIDASIATAIIYFVLGLGLFVFFQWWPNKYVWNEEKYDWIINIEKMSKRSINASTNK